MKQQENRTSITEATQGIAPSEPQEALPATIISALDKAGLTAEQFRVYCRIVQSAGGINREVEESEYGWADDCKVKKDTVSLAIMELLRRKMIAVVKVRTLGPNRTIRATGISEWRPHGHICEVPYVVVGEMYYSSFEQHAGKHVWRLTLVAFGIDWEGRRQVLAVEYANPESQSRWREFLLRLKMRGLNGVQLIVSDDHPGLKAAIQEVLPSVRMQRCCVHFLRNGLNCLPRKTDDNCIRELRWMYERRDVNEARRDLTDWLEKWARKYPILCVFVVANIEETWTFYRLPVAHHKRLKSTNLLEQFHRKIKQGGKHWDEAASLKAIQAVASEQHEKWMKGNRYLNADLLREQTMLPA